ncbi:6-phosphogluconolactonase [Pricia antarctica]|uniref:6-phosphogluconolactonase n=1 Tax=Pricia antarctica TaxID=641691 RepID=A0A1G7EQN3_9FLAO|nr:6-phosphogluconolactonase [Pricia antarctica]SDE65725.1 6-phosphogluconolactonase [Pricia antarctica]
MQLKISRTKQQTAEAFTDWLIQLIGSQDSLHIALSGGSTPKIVFDELASRHLSKNDWQKVHLYWGDERCVSPDDPESNYKMTVEYLLSKIEIPEENIHRIKGENDPRQEAERYTQVLREKLPIIDGLPQFDLIILGMGDDGHTASIFPYEIGLWNADQLCEVAEHPNTGQKRITITGRIINHADNVAFLVTGESKAEKVGEIVDERGGYKSYPANLVHPLNGNLFWFLDEAAASEITSQS